MSSPRRTSSVRAKRPDQPPVKGNGKRSERTDPPRSGPRQSRQQTDPSQDHPATNPASKRANGRRQSLKQKDLSVRDREGSPRTSERKCAEQRAPETGGARAPGPNNTADIKEAQGSENDAHERAKSGRRSKKQTDQSQDKPATGKSDGDPAPKRASHRQSQKQKDPISSESSELSNSQATGKRRPKATKTQSSASVHTDREADTLERVRQDATQHVLHATIEKLKIKKVERSAASSCVNEIIERIVSHLKGSMSWCEDIERLTTGSYYENLKICEPDEFDVMLTIPVERVDIEKVRDNEAFYSVALKRHPNKHFLAKFLNEDRTIKASEMLNEFRDGVKKAVESLSDKPYKIEVQRKRQRCPAVTLQVTEKGKEISLDFVLGLKVHGSWPKYTQDGFKVDGWLGTKEKKVLKRQPYYLVPKYEGRGSEEHDGVVAKDAWRISFSHVEKDILNRHGHSKTCCESKGPKCCRKECLKLLKYLLSQLKEKHSKKMSDFCSYHAKTTLLHACATKAEDSEWAYSQLADCFQQLLEDFVRYLKTQHLPNFFVPSHNLLKSDYVSKNSCEFLAKEIEIQRNNNFPIFQ